MEQEIKKKSYNPFKMWGFWIGFMLFIILSIRPCGIEAPNLVGSSNCTAWSNTDMGAVFLLIPAFALGVFGWGIHSLLRKIYILLFKKQ